MEASGSFTRTYKFAAVTAFTRGKKTMASFLWRLYSRTKLQALSLHEKNETLLCIGLVVNDRYFVFLKIALTVGTKKA